MGGKINLRFKHTRALLITLIAMVVVSGVGGQEIDADELAETERLQNRIVPVPSGLAGFQTGALLGVTVDRSKFSENWEPIYDDIFVFVDYEESGFILGSSFGANNQGRFDTEGHSTQVGFGHVLIPYEGILGFVNENFIITGGWGGMSMLLTRPIRCLSHHAKYPR